MKRCYFMILFLSLIFSLMGCDSSVHSNSNLGNHKDEDVAAIVRGKEITIGDLRVLYPDEKVLGNVEGAVKLELMIQEAKKMDIDILNEIEIQQKELAAFVSNEDNTAMVQFIASQAKKLGMPKEQYSKEYVKIRGEMDAYFNLYMNEMFDEPNLNDEKEIENHDERANEFLNKLVKENEEDIEIFIK